MTPEIGHKFAPFVARAGVFDVVKSYADMLNAIGKYGNDAKAKAIVSGLDDDRCIRWLDNRGLQHDNSGVTEFATNEHNDAVGMAFEVYAEFWLKYTCTPPVGVKDVVDTSCNKFQKGYDFKATSFHGEPVLIQVKYRSNPLHKFSESELGTFMQEITLSEDDVKLPDNAVLFCSGNHTPDRHNDDYGVFGSVRLLNKIRVIGQNGQRAYTDRDPKFWDRFRESLKATDVVSTFENPPKMREHQLEMMGGVSRVLNGELTRGRIICATGGGKTLVEYEAIRRGFEDGNKLQVIVAPLIGLLTQHHEYFASFGIFSSGNENVVPVHFRTGDEIRHDDGSDYEQTTNGEEFLSFVKAKHSDRKILVFVTYASYEHMFRVIAGGGTTAELAVFDEFHHTVIQTDEQRCFLNTMPVNKSLFFSASEKSGRVLSSFDESVYGPKLADISYNRLRQAGILVPKLEVKLVRMRDGVVTKTLNNALKEAAEREKFSLRDATLEAAALSIARLDMLKNAKTSAILTFSKSVPANKVLVNDPTFKSVLGGGCLLQTVHAGTNNTGRKATYNKVGKSTDSITMQHSVVKEGIDVTVFNALLLSRCMEVIGTQQAIGRIVRADPRDTEKLANGRISVNSSRGWKKYTATIYVLVDDTIMADYHQFLEELVSKLEGAGLTSSDCHFSEITESHHGVETDDMGFCVGIRGCATQLDDTAYYDMLGNIEVIQKNRALDAEKAECEAAVGTMTYDEMFAFTVSIAY